MRVGELIGKLEREGHHLGKYPLRTIASTITSPATAELFVLKRAQGVLRPDDEVSIAPERSIRDLL